MFILDCDIDKTLTGDVHSINLLNNEIDILRKERPLTLIYNTGRSYHEWKRLRNESEHYKLLLVPEYLVVAGGTEIYKYSDGKFVLDDTYEQNITQAYSKPKIVEIMKDYDEMCSHKLSEDVAKDRHRHTITLHKHSVENAEEIIQEVRQKLNALGIRVELVLETDVDWLKGDTYIDILPQNCSKASALDYLVEKIAPRERKTVVWCGDSINDKSMLHTPYLGIIVGNAQAVLKDNANPNLHYIASSNHSAGIIEGLRHFKISKTDESWSLGHRFGIGVAVSVGVVALVMKLRNSQTW